MRHIKFVYAWIALCIALLLTLSVLSPTAAALPPRPDPTPTPRHKVGAGIMLSVSGATSPYSAVVQWQDGLGDWHDIDGWRGEVENDRVLWYVSPDQFDIGPFRWTIYSGTNILGISEPFDTPSGANTLVHVSVTANP